MSTQTIERPALAEATPLAPKSNVVPYTAQPVARAYPPKMAKALLAIKREVGAIAKATSEDDPNGGWNKFHNYGYQKWEDVLDRLSVLEAQHGLIVQQSEVARSILDKLISISYCFTIVNEDGDVWPDRPEWTAIARLIDIKGVFDDKAANKCHTQAHKYFLLHTFKIRTKDTVEDDSDGDAPAAKQTPKPPKPGSPEAATLDGPRAITEGHDAASWADAFLVAIKDCTAGDYPKWIDANAIRLDKLKAYPEVDAKVQAALKAMVTPTPKAPKPPKPETAQAKPTMPDPATDAPGWVAWLIAKMASFETYQAGETYWNDHIDPLDLPRAVQEDAMGIWSRFEERFEA